MKKTIRIGEKDYHIKSSAYTIFKYKNDTGRDLLNDLKELSTLTSDNALEQLTTLNDTLLRITYVMILEADNNQVEDYESWLKSIDNVYGDVKWMSDSLECAIAPFSGGIETNKA